MAETTSPKTSALSSRATTGFGSLSVEEAVPDTDPSTTAGLLGERLQAWKHLVVYLQDYMAVVERIHGRQGKEYEKVLKTISNPLRHGHHFNQSLGGVAGFFENMRANTQAMINSNLETEKSIKGSVLPILDRLHKEIKHKAKELQGGAQSSAKEVEKLRNTTQKQIELLGQQTAAFDSAGGKFHGQDDPYVVLRGVMHRLSNQVVAENNHRNDLMAVQANFMAFERHVLEVVQQAIEAFVQLAGGQGEKMRALYSDMLGTIQAVLADFEWNKFSSRSGDRLVRAVDAIQFPNMDHSSTRPLMEGSLERKSCNKLSWGYATAYYVTPVRFLHEFKDSDDRRVEPKPELSVYLPDAIIGAPSGERFNVKGKDRSKTISSKLTGSSELAFKAHTADDARKWFHVIQAICGATGPAESSSPAVAPDETPPAKDEEVQDSKAQDAGEAVAPPADSALAHRAQEAGVTDLEPAPADKKSEAAVSWRKGRGFQLVASIHIPCGWPKCMHTGSEGPGPLPHDLFSPSHFVSLMQLLLRRLLATYTSTRPPTPPLLHTWPSSFFACPYSFSCRFGGAGVEHLRPEARIEYRRGCHVASALPPRAPYGKRKSRAQGLSVIAGLCFGGVTHGQECDQKPQGRSRATGHDVLRRPPCGIVSALRDNATERTLFLQPVFVCPPWPKRGPISLFY